MDLYLLGDPKRLEQAKQQGTHVWLSHVGDKPSIADLSAVCEVYQYHYLPEKYAHIMKTFPRVKAWYDRMFQIPEVQEVHEFVGKNIERLRKMVAKRKAEAKL